MNIFHGQLIIIFYSVKYRKQFSLETKERSIAYVILITQNPAQPGSFNEDRVPIDITKNTTVLYLLDLIRQVCNEVTLAEFRELGIRAVMRKLSRITVGKRPVPCITGFDNQVSLSNRLTIRSAHARKSEAHILVQ